MTRPSRFFRHLRQNRSGVAMTEFALSLPFLLTAGLWGVETAHFALVNTKVSQVASHLADNASRIGDTSTLEDRKIYEADINDLLLGADIGGGQNLSFYEHGRAIISSLEVVPGTEDQQYIHWQRCKGKKVSPSSYGNEGDGLSGSLVGMGPIGEEVMATEGVAVIFVEVAYDYQPLINMPFSRSDTIRATSSYMVRDSRDLSQIYQRDSLSPDTVSRCTTYDSFAPASGA